MKIIAMVVLMCAAPIALGQVVPGVALQLGTVIDVQHGQVQRTGTYGGTGSVVGAAIGGLAGYSVSRKSNTGRFIASTLGGVLGASVGRAVEGRQRSAQVVVVQLDNGRVLALPALRVDLRPGQRVGVGSTGYGRDAQAVIVPLNSAIAARGVR